MNPPPLNGEEVTRRFLTAAEYFLRVRNFKDCRNYTLRARESDSTRPEPDRILSIVSVLSAPNITSNLPDYYAILDVPRFESNADRIWSNFKTLEANLNPNANSYSFSEEAHSLLMKAWGVLSNPTEKAAFDAELRGDSEGCTAGSRNSTFWTMCPYCYYVYEYDRGFEDCCLRCTNEKCQRTLHAVELSGPPPPPTVADTGRYYCPGFVQFVSGDSNMNEIGKSLWSPFDFPKPCNSTTFNNGETPVQFGSKFEAGDGDENGSEYLHSDGLKETKKSRKTCVNWQSKKLMGRGLNVDMNKANAILSGGFEDKGPYLDGVGEECSVPGFGDETRNDDTGEVEFFEGDGDVLVGLQSIF